MRRLVFALFFLSGALGLLYEVVWLRLLILVFGSTHFATTAILTAFMAGLALGSFLLGRWADRTSRHPLALYGFLEIGIGAYALLVPLVFRALGPISSFVWDRFEPSFYVASLVRFAFALAALLLPAAMMGGTLPILSRLVARREGEIAGSVGALYAANTLGAVAGTAITGFFLIPVIGVTATIFAAAAANVAVGFAALALARRAAAGAAPAGTGGGGDTGRTREAGKGRAAPAAEASASAERGRRRRAVLWAVAGSGFLALLYEIAWTRVLALVLGSSVYAFTAMLATFLVGIAAGAYAGSAIADRLGGGRRGMEAIAAALALMAVSGYVTLLLMQRLPSMFGIAFHRLGLARIPASEAWSGAVKLIGIEFAIAFAVMLPATIFSGILFPLAVRQWAGGVDHVAGSVGTVYASNTCGTILGAGLGGFVVLPWTGLQGGIIAAVVGGLLVAAAVTWAIPGWTTARRVAAAAVAAALCGAAVMARPAWDPLVMNSGIFQYVMDLSAKDLSAGSFSRLAKRGVELLYYEEGMTASVLVAREPRINNIFMATNGKIDASSSSDIATQLLLGHLPMLWARAGTPPAAPAAAPGGSPRFGPPSVAVIGYASGMTVGAVMQHPVGSITAVEIEPAVIRASRHFDPFNHAPLSDPRVRVVEADGRNFLLVTRERYDAIISEPSNPWMTVASNLFTREFFETGRGRLKPGGVFCQWVQLYGLRTQDLRAVVRTFASVFSHVSMFLPIGQTDIILLGSDAPLLADIGALHLSLARPHVARDLARMRVESIADLLTYHLMSDAEARAFAGEGPLNTDDNALIEFGAPLSLHAQTRAPNQAALDAHAGDPLAGAVAQMSNPADAAAEYTHLGKAFFRRGMAARAAAALRRAQALLPTEEAAALLARYEEAAAIKPDAERRR